MGSSDLVQSMIGRGKTASAMPWLKVWVVYLAIPFSQGVLSLRLVAQIIEDCKALFGKSSPLSDSSAGGEPL